MSFIFVSTGVNLWNQSIKIGIRSEGPFWHEFLTTRWTLFVSTPQRSDNTLLTEAVQTLFGGHRTLEHVQAYRAHEFTVEAAWRHGDLRGVGDCFLRSPVQLVQAQLPVLTGDGRVLHLSSNGYPISTSICNKNSIMYTTDRIIYNVLYVNITILNKATDDNLQ